MSPDTKTLVSAPIAFQTSLTKHECKDQMMKNFKTATQFGLAGAAFLSSGIFLGWGKEEKPTQVFFLM